MQGTLSSTVNSSECCTSEELALLESDDSSSAESDSSDEEEDIFLNDVFVNHLAKSIFGKRRRGFFTNCGVDDDGVTVGYIYWQFDSMDEQTFVEEIGLNRRQFRLLEQYAAPRISAGMRSIPEHCLSARMKLAVLIRYCRKWKWSNHPQDGGNYF